MGIRIRETIDKYIREMIPAGQLVFFRILFGSLLLFSTLRFMSRGWVKEFYIDPNYHFTYLGFDWVQPLPGNWMYLPFILMAVCAVFIIIGFLYRPSMALFFLAFTYVELLDKTYYLNHYVFVSIFTFFLIFFPLNADFSLDKKLFGKGKKEVFKWQADLIRLQIFLVYFLAGVAKLKYDWMFEAQPLKIWLEANRDLPVLGNLLSFQIAPYLFSWAGLIFDLFIGFFLFWRKSRPYAYLLVVIFHVVTGSLFYIGIFPVIMIGCATAFFDHKDLERLLSKLGKKVMFSSKETAVRKPGRQLVWIVGVLFLVTQLLISQRFRIYDGNVLWHERGFRFAMHVMLMEKNGYVEYNVEDTESGRKWVEYPQDYLTPQQVKMMASQPDMILQFAHFIEDESAKKGYGKVEITAQTYVSLNGRPGKPLIKKDVDLTQISATSSRERWVSSWSSPD